MLMKTIVVSVLLFVLSTKAFAVNTWTDWGQVKEIYTYTGENTLFLFLEHATCPGVKKYFSIHPAYAPNADQLISMVLAAKLAGKRVDVLFDPDQNETHCYVKGLKIEG